VTEVNSFGLQLLDLTQCKGTLSEERKFKQFALKTREDDKAQF